MSNNPTPPRIEREAEAFKQRPHYKDGSCLSVSPQIYLKRGYIAGALEEMERAAPVVKALELALQGYRENKVLITPEEVETILETYKADV